jgi:hypothetical protein
MIASGPITARDQSIALRGICCCRITARTSTARLCKRSTRQVNELSPTVPWPTLADRFANYELSFPSVADHVRIAIRRFGVFHDVAWLSTNRCCPGEPRFPILGTLGMIAAEVERDGKTSISRRYYPDFTNWRLSRPGKR